MVLNLGAWTLDIKVYRKIFHPVFRKKTLATINRTSTDGFFPDRCYCGQEAVVKASWKTSVGNPSILMCREHAQDFQKVWGRTEAGLSCIWSDPKEICPEGKEVFIET